MGKVIIQEMTTKNPIQLMGLEAGICWNSNTSDSQANYKRGLDCLQSEHGRVSEFPQIFMVLSGYSARVIREYYTHIGGDPTRLQASTRYIDYSDFKYVIPHTVARNAVACKIYTDMMKNIATSIKSLEVLGIPKEDCGLGLPLGMETEVVVRTNLRQLLDMIHTRSCTRAYWEFRELINDIIKALKDYSPEWKELGDKYFISKCEYFGYCTEKNSCGRRPKKSEVINSDSSSS